MKQLYDFFGFDSFVLMNNITDFTSDAINSTSILVNSSNCTFSFFKVASLASYGLVKTGLKLRSCF